MSRNLFFENELQMIDLSERKRVLELNVRKAGHLSPRILCMAEFSSI